MDKMIRSNAGGHACSGEQIRQAIELSQGNRWWTACGLNGSLLRGTGFV